MSTDASRSLTFEGRELSIIDRDGQQWLRGPQIADALGYKQSNRVHDIYSAHADEFTESMTRLVELDTAGGKQQVRIFSLRGAHLIAMFSRTRVAKAFRVWVLDRLEEEQSPPAIGHHQPDPPGPAINRFRILTTFENGEQIESRVLTDDVHVATAEEFERLQAKTGQTIRVNAANYHAIKHALKVLWPQLEVK